MIRRTERVDQRQVEGYRGTFAEAESPLHPGDLLPVAWEGILFPFAVPFAQLRPDGTPGAEGIPLAAELPRRMYAGEDTTFFAPIRIGDEINYAEAAGQVTEKRGIAGRLVFCDLLREYWVGDTLAVESTWHDVFLGAPPDDAPPREPRRDPDIAHAAEWSDFVCVDARQLFRFSALTFNTHLVHYDRSWAREVEGLPDLLVHGPLMRILMTDAARRRHPGREAASLSVRMSAPAFVDRPMRIAGREHDGNTRVSILDETDVVLARAEVRWR